jgi:multidrug efflux system outer membrane protein
MLLSGSVLLFAGCTTMGPDYQAPQIDVPEQWQAAISDAATQANVSWWKRFHDPVLDELIQTALKNNLDLRVAAARVVEYAARVDIAHSGIYPNLGYGGSLSRSQVSRSTLGALPDGISRVGSDYQSNLGMSWELDLWGRIQRSTEAARANLLAAEHGRRAIVLSLVSGVAGSYIELLSLDRQLQIAKDTLKRRAETVELFNTQFEGGVVSKLEVVQARAEYETTAILIPAIEQQIRITEYNLSVLLGRNPGAIARNTSIDDLHLPGVPADIPSQVLLQRPDILLAEQNLISANALIGVARAAYFPSISLTGLFGLASAELSTLLDGASGVWNAGAAVAGPIFSGGALDAQVRASEAVHQQLLQTYFLTIKTAFAEVDKALISARKLQEILEASSRQVKSLKEYARFAKERYDEGYVSYIEVLDSERRLFDAELEYTKRQGNVYVALVSIYKAMGGGWVSEAEEVANAVDFSEPSEKEGRKWWQILPQTQPAAVQRP